MCTVCGAWLFSIQVIHLEAPIRVSALLFTEPLFWSGMAKRSVGLVMYRVHNCALEVLLVHPGGPIWAKKDFGVWSIPKGEYDETEQPLEAAIREFKEEKGFEVDGPYLELGSVKQSSGKIVTAWAFAGDCDPALIISNLCWAQWPSRSGPSDPAGGRPRRLVYPCGRQAAHTACSGTSVAGPGWIGELHGIVDP